jgi:hypothetical protein
MERGLAASQVSTLPPELSLMIRKCYPLQEYEVTVKKLKNKTVLQKNGGMSIPNILARNQRRFHCHTAKLKPKHGNN